MPIRTLISAASGSVSNGTAQRLSVFLAVETPKMAMLNLSLNNSVYRFMLPLHNIHNIPQYTHKLVLPLFKCVSCVEVHMAWLVESALAVMSLDRLEAMLLRVAECELEEGELSRIPMIGTETRNRPVSCNGIDWAESIATDSYIPAIHSEAV
jgi:hypothetical protein